MGIGVCVAMVATSRIVTVPNNQLKVHQDWCTF